MRLAFGAVWHETNTFSPVATTAADFVDLGQERPEEPGGSPAAREFVSQVAKAAEEAAAGLLPALVVGAASSGPVPGETLDGLIGSLLERLSRLGRHDGVLLCLSGTLVAANDDDGDARIVERVRRAMGPDVPIGVILGPHANLSRRLVDAANVVGFDGAPQGRMAMFLAMLAAGRRTVPALVKLPLLIPPLVAASRAFTELRAGARALRGANGVVDATLLPGFPFADVPHAGAGVLVYAADAARAQRAASELADEVWARRHDLTARAMNIETAIHEAMAADDSPTLLLDSGDDPAAGGPGDGTALLWALLDLGAERAALGFLHDPEAVARGAAAGPGTRVRLALGAHLDRRHGYPIEVEAEVARISDGSLSRSNSVRPDRSVRHGRIVVLRIGGRHGGQVEVLVSERRIEVDHAGSFAQLGLDLTARQIVAVKGGIRAARALKCVAARTIEVATPGVTVPDFAYYAFQRLPRPVYPLGPI